MLLCIQLQITRLARPYQNGSNRCNLCLEEKNVILQANPVHTLNKRAVLVSKCRHKAKYKPRNHQPNETKFNANRLITVTYNAALYLGQCLNFNSVFHNV